MYPKYSFRKPNSLSPSKYSLFVFDLWFSKDCCPQTNVFEQEEKKAKKTNK